MDLQEFKEKFEGKVIEDPAHLSNFIEDIRVIDKGVCGIRANGYFAVRYFAGHRMEIFKLYEPPKPEFDFNGPGFWGSVGTLNFRYYDKAGICSWLAHCDSGNVYLCGKKTILGEATPCDPPKKGEGWDHILEALEEK